MSLLVLLIGVLVGLHIAAPTAEAQDVYHVTKDGNGSGSSFDNDPISLQGALGQADGDDVIVIAAGTYLPTDDPSNRDARFEITGAQDGLKIYGGWTGATSFSSIAEVEGNLASRDLGGNLTVLSGDIDDNDAKTNGITEDAADISGANSKTVVYFDGTTGGNITTGTVLDGLLITGGQASGGSGGPEASRGGGVYCKGDINGNRCSPVISNTRFIGNSASGNGGAIFNEGFDNGASSPQLTNVTFTGNSASDNGGAIFNDGSDNGVSSPQLTNVTFTGNSAGKKGGAIFNDGFDNGASSPQLTNVILWENSAGGDGNEIYNDAADPTLRYTLIQGGLPPGTNDGGDNRFTSPDFVNPDDPIGPDGTFGTEDDGLRLLTGSPALDAGDNTPFNPGGFLEGITTDLLGEDRIQNGTVSLGAYERGDDAARLRLVARPGTETSTFELSNLGNANVTGAAVDLGLPTGVSITGDSGNGGVTGDTWTVDVPAENAVTVRVDVERDASADPGLLDLTAELADNYSIEGGAADATQPDDDTAGWALLEAPYGPGTALSFNGSDSYLSTGAGGDALGLVGASFTVEAWVKADALSGDHSIIGQDASGTREGLHLILRDGNVHMGFFSDDLTGDTALQTGQWYHVAYVFDATTDRQEVYLNGTLDGERTAGGDFAGTAPVQIGRWRGGNYFDGEMDELRIWSEARTEDQIQATMHQTIPADPTNTPGLVASYRFDAAQTDQRFDDSHGGTTAYDLTGGRNASFEGDPQWAESGARVGQESVTVDANGTGAVGPNNAQLAVTSTSDPITLYRYGDPSAEVFADDGIPKDVRSNAVWGAVPTGNADPNADLDADLELTYGDVTVPNSSDVGLAERPFPAQPWTTREEEPSGETFTLTGPTGPGEFTLYEAESAIYHVTEDGDAGNDGSSFADADAISLQGALGQADGNDEIWIAEGVYTPATEDDSFTITGTIDGVELYGGFDGSETDRDQRDPDANVTVLSGDVDRNDTVNGNGVTETASSINGPNANHVIVLNGGESIGPNIAPNITPNTVIDGVAISAGQTEGSTRVDLSGGGIFCDGSESGNECSPTLRNVVFAGNDAGSGGALYIDGDGGQSSLEITQATFTSNLAIRGGAIYNRRATPIIKDASFTDNEAVNSGGALLNIASADEVASPTITNAIFSGNAVPSGNGGAISNIAAGGETSPQITNTAFTDNTASDAGGAIYNRASFTSATSSPMITNSIFTANSVGPRFGGGAIYSTAVEGTSRPVLTNSILWKNSAPDGGDEMDNNRATPTLRYTLIDGGVNGPGVEGDPNTDGGNNRDADPLFVDAAQPAGNDGTFATGDDGLRLAGNSPAVDAGTNTPFESGGGAEEVDTDLIGNPRIQDGDGDGTATVALGAYEAPGLPIATSVTITGTDGTGNDAGWRIVSVPYTGAVAGDLRMSHSAGTNAPRFDQNVVAVWDDSDPDESTGGTGAYITADASTPLEHGSAALLYLQDDARDPVESGGLTVSLSESTAATRHGLAPVVRDDLTPSARWHLLGNPYPTDYELSSLTTGGNALAGNGFQADAQVYDATGGTWQLVDTETETLAAWQGFFIERSTYDPPSGPTTVTFESTGRTDAGAPFIGSAMQGPTTASTSVQRGTLGLEGTVTDATGDTVATDRAIGVRFHENASEGWDAWDTSKLAPLETPSLMLSAQGTGPEGSIAAKAIESRPWPQDPDDPDADLTSVPVAANGNELPDSGTLTVQVRDWDLPDTWAAELIDTQGTADTSDDQTVPFGPGMHYDVDVSSLSANPETERFVVQIAPNAGALPVELAGLQAQRTSTESVTVQWETLSETNNAGFEVQRRITSESNVETSRRDVSTGASWQTLATVDGAGTTDEPQSYRFEDTGLPYAADSLSYRLRQIDTGGTASLSEAVTIARPVEAAELLPTYPNPARSTATVRFAVPERQAVRIHLYDLLGRRVKTVVDTDAEGRMEQTLNVSDLASGTYFLRMETEAGPIDTQRVTVVR